MTANTMTLSDAEEEVRNILDEAISASITASTPGISWGKLMTIIQMQRPLVDDYISQRRKVQPIREVNIGDSVNPFRAEIVKLICALQLTGRFRDTNTASWEVTRTNSRVLNPYEVRLHDNCHQSGSEITVSKKCKNTKWGVKHFGKGNKMHEVSEEKPLLNTYNDAAGGQNCGPFSFTFNVHKEELTKGHTTDQLNEPNVETTTYRNDYNSYLIARYESEYSDVNLLSTRDGEFTKERDEEEAAQCAERDMYELKKCSTDDLCMYSKNKSETLTPSSSTTGIHCVEQTSGQGVAKASPRYHHKTCGTEEEQTSGTNLSPTYSVICANSSSEHLAQMSHKNARDYTHKKKRETDEQEESISEVTDPESVCELYRMKEKLHYDTLTDSKSNNLNNKSLVTSDELHLHSVARSPTQHAMDQRTSAAKDIFKKCSLPPGNTAEYLFQNFIQPEDENNIQLLLSSGHSSPHCRSADDINEVLGCTLEATQGNEKTGTSIQIPKTSSGSLNDQKEKLPSVGRKEVFQEFQVKDFQQHLNDTKSSGNIADSNCIGASYVNKADYGCQNENAESLFSNKKVYWSSVGLIIEDLIDSNVLPVAGHSDMTLGESQDSKADKKSDDQIIDIGNTSYSRPDATNGTEDSSFINEPDVEGSTDLVEKERSLSGKLLSEDDSAKSKNTKKSQQKRSFFKSLQRVFHLSRNH